MALTLVEGRERADALAEQVNGKHGSGRVSGMWSEGKIAWKINTDKGVVYKNSPDTITPEGMDTMVVNAMRDGPSVISKISDKIPGRRRAEEDKPAVEVDPDVLERAIAQNVSKSEIHEGGGKRKDEYGVAYWLTLEQIIELNELDDAIVDTFDFWDAFAEMRRRLSIEPLYKTVKWSGTSHTGGKGYMKQWWSGGGSSYGGSYGGYSTTAKNTDSARLALALGVISSVVQIINNKAQVWKLRFATEDTSERPMSFTSYDNRQIVISPQALLDTKLREDEQIEISTGFGLHEGSHTEHSEDLSKTLRLPRLLSPIAVAAMLLNIIEDVRIERLTGELFPGFVSYFDRMNSYLWDTAVEKNVPKGWGPTLTDKLNAIIGICKWPDEVKPMIKDPVLDAEYDWFRAWTGDYIKEKTTAREAVEKALEHLQEDPETKKEMEEMAAEDAKDARLGKESSFGEGLGAAMERMKGRGTVIEACPSPSGAAGAPGVLESEVAEEVEKLTREELEEKSYGEFVHAKSGRGLGAPRLLWSKPELPDKVAHRPHNPLIDRMRHAFRFRKARPMYSTRLLRSGQLDEEEMWRVLGHDFRTFEQRVIESDPDTQVTLLIDASGSMSSPVYVPGASWEATRNGVRKIETATNLATVLLACLKDMKGVRVRVRAHTSETSSDTGGGVCHIYRIWEPGDEVRRLNIMPTHIPMTANYDGFAIAACADEMLADSRPGEDMVMIVLADGLPAGGGGFYYHGENAIAHVRQVHQAYEKKGMSIIQIAIDTEVGPAEQARMFGDHFISYSTEGALPKQLTDLLIKIFGASD